MRTAEKVQPRGWEALKAMLEKQGLSSTEIEEARDSFCQGIEVLSQLFLSLYQVKDMKKENMKKENNVDKS